MRPKELAQVLLKQANDSSGSYPDWMREQWIGIAEELQRLTDVTPLPAEVLTADGGLHRYEPHLHWSPGEGRVTLEGQFTAAELRAIATHMEAPQFAPYA